MAKPPDTTLGRNIRELTRGLADAPDGHVARVVAMVDQLPTRGEADQLIAPLRPRLARLGLPRPLRFTRLLFLPLDPVVVPPPRWRPANPAIPRSVLVSLAMTVRACIGAETAQVDALIEAASSQDAEITARAGALLWPRAADALSRVPPPVAWAETGLNPALYAPLARRTAAILRQALAIEELVAEAAIGILPPRPAAIRRVLTEVCEECLDACPMLVTVLLRRLPQCGGVLAAIAAELGPPTDAVMRQAGQEAVEALLTELESPREPERLVAGHDLAGSVLEVRRTAALLKQLGERSDLPQMRARLQALRQRVDAGCRTVFTHALAAEFLPALRQTGNDASLEATARRLRELESDARPLGGGEAYDAQLRQAAAAVAAERSRPPVARARLVEILAGPEAALAVLGHG